LSYFCRTLFQRLRYVAEQRSAETFCYFLIDDTVHEITFGELFSQAEAYSQYYIESGLGRSDIVFIVLRHRPDLLYAFVGAMLIGCIPSFLAPIAEKQDPETFWTTLRHLFGNVGASAAIIEPDQFSEISRSFGVSQIKLLLPIETSCKRRSSGEIAWYEPKPDDIAFLQFSSGTTGLRKGVMLTHRVVIEQIEIYRQAIGLGPHDRVASWLPLYHDMGLIACFVLPLLTATPIVMLDAFDWVYEPERLFAAITRYGATLIWLPNFAFNHLRATVAADERHDLSSVRAFINCSEPCKIESMRRFVEHFAPINVLPEQMQTCYAMAEAVFAVTQSTLGLPPVTLSVDREIFETEHQVVVADKDHSAATLELVSVGRLLPGFVLRIIGPDHRDLPAGHVGEIIIRGPSVFGGYYRAPRATAEAFADGWYLTGDLGFIHGNDVYVTGRNKDIIIAYGKNYYAHDIEALVSGVEGIKAGRVVAFGVYNHVSGSEDVVIVAETNDTENKQRMISTVRSAVAGGLGLAVSSVTLVPSRWLIKTTSGKVSRAQNREKYLQMTALAAKTLPQQ
jgi:fatty-acyl-CoA synthase